MTFLLIKQTSYCYRNNTEHELCTLLEENFYEKVLNGVIILLAV